MNWLAHVHLSEPEFDFRLGNLLADFVRGADRDRASEGFRRGAARHLAIDAFTDAHPVVGRSRGRIRSECRRFAGILVDIFYDHFLACQWPRHSVVPFDQFRADFYRQLRDQPFELPADACTVIGHIVATDRFGAYQEVAGIRNTLERFSRRLSEHWGRPVNLAVAIGDLEQHYAGFEADFDEFFPALRAEVMGGGSGNSRPT